MPPDDGVGVEGPCTSAREEGQLVTTLDQLALRTQWIGVLLGGHHDVFAFRIRQLHGLLLHPVDPVLTRLFQCLVRVWHKILGGNLEHRNALEFTLCTRRLDFLECPLEIGGPVDRAQQRAALGIVFMALGPEQQRLFDGDVGRAAGGVPLVHSGHATVVLKFPSQQGVLSAQLEFAPPDAPILVRATPGGVVRLSAPTFVDGLEVGPAVGGHAHGFTDHRSPGMRHVVKALL